MKRARTVQFPTSLTQNVLLICLTHLVPDSIWLFSLGSKLLVHAELNINQQYKVAATKKLKIKKCKGL